MATTTPALPHAPSPVLAPAAGGLPADDDDSLVKDRDGGHLAGSGSPALPGASHSDLAGIRSSDDKKNPKTNHKKNRKGGKAGGGHVVSPYAC